MRTLGSLARANWPDIQRLRGEVMRVSRAGSLSGAAQQLAGIFAEAFDSIVLARVFVVLPFATLPELERSFATRLAQTAPLNAQTPVLCLLGTRGRRAEWNERARSQGHLAIPLLSSASVAQAPMIARLLADLRVDIHGLDHGRPLASKELLRGRSATFFVPDALSTTDADGRLVIPAHDFARAESVRSVFGTGGAYLDGTLVVAILFCSEPLDREIAERYASFISAFKLATADLVKQHRVFEQP